MHDQPKFASYTPGGEHVPSLLCTPAAQCITCSGTTFPWHNNYYRQIILPTVVKYLCKYFPIMDCPRLMHNIELIAIHLTRDECKADQYCHATKECHTTTQLGCVCVYVCVCACVRDQWRAHKAGA